MGVSSLGGFIAGVNVPRTPVLPRPYENRQVAASCCIAARAVIPVASVRSRPFQDVEVSLRGGITAGALVELPAIVLCPAKDI